MNKVTYEDAFNLLCGKKLGEGVDRTVFACKIRPELVVKVESGDCRYFANVLEQMFWDDFKLYKPVAKWLAPCEFLSPDGRILLQWRAEPVPLTYKLPRSLPEFLTDLKRENFGLIGGKLVAVDYSRNIGNPSTKLRNATWR